MTFKEKVAKSSLLDCEKEFLYFLEENHRDLIHKSDDQIKAVTGAGFVDACFNWDWATAALKAKYPHGNITRVWFEIMNNRLYCGDTLSVHKEERDIAKFMELHGKLTIKEII